MISLSDLGMRFGGHQLFDGVVWQLGARGHYGLVGANGSGKSTLLRLMSGELTPEAGSIGRPSGLRLGTLGQDHFRFDDVRLLDAVLMGHQALWDALAERQRLLRDEAQATSPRTGERLGELEVMIAEQRGYDAEARAAALLAGLGLEPERHERPMSELSGGFRLRVLLAQTLFSDPDLLLLDEPTNHLDIASIQWLEGYLRDFRGTFVVVSHDRHFLNAICDTIADLDYQELRLYTGNYDAFEGAKALAIEQKEEDIQRTEARTEKMQEFIDRFRAKATKARQASARKKQVAKMELPEITRSSRRTPGFQFQQGRPSGREPLRVDGLAKSFNGREVLHDVSFTVERGDKIAVLGPNGVGKSTLLKLITGALDPDAGGVEFGYEVSLGYFAQDVHEALHGTQTAYDWLRAESGNDEIAKLRGTLGRVLFSGDDAQKRVGDLSGGESARLLLGALMLRAPNLMVLDEPTNHVDLEGREALMRALRDYPGTLIFVSHDRHFVANVGTRVLALTPDQVEDFTGSYEEYLKSRGNDYFALGQAKPHPRKQPTGVQKGAGRRAYAETREQRRAIERLTRVIARLEGDIARLEGELETFTARFNDNGYYQRVSIDELRADERSRRELSERLESTMREWEAKATELESRRGAD